MECGVLDMECAALTHEISSRTLKEKFHISAHPCIIHYIIKSQPSMVTLPFNIIVVLQYVSKNEICQFMFH